MEWASPAGRRVAMRLPLLVLAFLLWSCGVSTERDAPALTAGAEAEDQRALYSCFQTLAPTEPTVRASVQRKFRLSQDDAVDVVRDALLDVCIRHAQSPYPNLVGALQVASNNGATDRWRHGRRHPRCQLDDATPSCGQSADEAVRIRQEHRIVEASLCKENAQTQQIIRMHVHEGMKFERIARVLLITEAQARSRFNHAVERARKHVQKTCNLDGLAGSPKNRRRGWTKRVARRRGGARRSRQGESNEPRIHRSRESGSAV